MVFLELTRLRLIVGDVLECMIERKTERQRARETKQEGGRGIVRGAHNITVRVGEHAVASAK